MVESLGAKAQDRLQGPSQYLHVIERFTRVADNALLYRFTIEDPGTWVAPWTGEFTWPATNEQIYEYACHEANYAMENILRGARRRAPGRALERDLPWRISSAARVGASSTRQGSSVRL